MDGLTIERRESILLLTIDRDHVRNAIDAATAVRIDEALRGAEADETIGAIVLTGSGDNAFCSGMDMKEAARVGIGHGLVADRGFAGITHSRLTKPLVAAVNGAALAGGLEIVLACDLVFAADHARFELSEVKRGLFAFAGGVQRLARQVPRATGLAMILSGESLSAQRAYQLGIVTEVVQASNLLTHALETTSRILSYPWEAIQNAKQLYETAYDATVDQAMQFGAAFGQAAMRSNANVTDGVRTFADHGSRGDDTLPAINSTTKI